MHNYIKKKQTKRCIDVPQRYFPSGMPKICFRWILGSEHTKTRELVNARVCQEIIVFPNLNCVEIKLLLKRKINPLVPLTVPKNLNEKCFENWTVLKAEIKTIRTSLKDNTFHYKID